MTAPVYVINIANTHQQTFAPLIFNVGYINQKSINYSCITKYTPMEFTLLSINNNLQQIKNNIVQANSFGSYTVQMFDLTNSNNPPVLFSFYVFNRIFYITNEIIYSTINRELPAIYSQENQLNNIDNAASAGVISALYNYIYTLFANSTVSLGVGKSFNPDLEIEYIGVRNFLQNVLFPAQFLKTLLNINTQCSVQRFSIIILISRLIYQFTGTATPVQMVYNTTNKIYEINIYYSVFKGWALGDAGRSELGNTTYLLGQTQSPFLWIINEILNRVMPAVVFFNINYLTIKQFNTNFNIALVNLNDFYNPAQLYDAYSVVNNNNNFNTKGYILN